MSVDAVEGRYNVVLADQYETFDYQIPIDQFVRELEGGKTFDEVCVINLGEMFEADEIIRLTRAMQDSAMDLNRAGATIQFAVEGSIQSVPGGFELLYDDDLYRLDKVFGADLTDREDGWLTATF
jgi:hypothetical protein